MFLILAKHLWSYKLHDLKSLMCLAWVNMATAADKDDKSDRKADFRISPLPAEYPFLRLLTVVVCWRIDITVVQQYQAEVCTNLSPWGGRGRGPWPLGRSIRGESGGRPDILLSRPEKHMNARIKALNALIVTGRYERQDIRGERWGWHAAKGPKLDFNLDCCGCAPQGEATRAACGLENLN